MTRTVLVIPVPELEPAAQIALLDPFAGLDEISDGMLAELRAVFADVTAFPFKLAAIRESAGTAYLSPEPRDPFRHLSQELVRRFPEYPPQRSLPGDVVAQLNLPEAPMDRQRRRLALERRLPILAYANAAELWWYGPGGRRTLERFPFGTTAA